MFENSEYYSCRSSHFRSSRSRWKVSIINSESICIYKVVVEHPRDLSTIILELATRAGDSYAEQKTHAIIVKEISKGGNEAGLRVQLNLSRFLVLAKSFNSNHKLHMNQGYFIGNPGVNNSPKNDYEVVSYAHRMALNSYEHFKLGNGSCYGEFMNPGLENDQCLYALRHIDECLRDTSKEHALEPSCSSTTPDESNLGNLLLEEARCDIILPAEREKSWCRFHNYPHIYTYANDPTVREALHIRKGTKETWLRCNRTLAYDFDIIDAVPYHQFLSLRKYSALVYSGDDDCQVPFWFTLKWIRDLNLTLEEKWRPWYVDGQLAGYTEKYEENGFHLTFATGAGHSTPEYKPKECLAMIDSWFSGQPF
ncbi:hypothetical protein Leryth_024293 [Lithospermum erythrorhizon]|nr:hypothetical protein Leryth_024293 [Lithospermum erythrorhizon]